MDKTYLTLAIRDKTLLDRAKAVGAEVKTWQAIEDFLLPRGVIFSHPHADGYMWEFRFRAEGCPVRHIHGIATSNEIAHLFMLQKAIFALYDHIHEIADAE